MLWGAVATLCDADIVSLLMEQLLPEAVAGFKGVKVVDSFVQRYPGAVTWFSPGSFQSRPPLETAVRNLVCAGDWVRLGKREHGAKVRLRSVPLLLHGGFGRTSAGFWLRR
jgi:uncharacterized protein with NAD-binding domain and iron-sulfur cluster